MNLNDDENINEENNVHKTLLKIFNKIYKNKLLCAFIIINIILCLIILYVYIKVQIDTNIEIDNSEIIQNSIITENNTTKEEIMKIKIHIAGEVKNSGIYELEKECRISDAIEKAGGITPDADLTNVNLAYKLSDGQKIIIPSIEQENNGNYIIEESGENIIENEKNTKNSKININTAGITELITLPGIGESTAQKIIDYRDENGKFENIEDIKKISGIGESKYNLLKDYIKVK